MKHISVYNWVTMDRERFITCQWGNKEKATHKKTWSSLKEKKDSLLKWWSGLESPIIPKQVYILLKKVPRSTANTTKNMSWRSSWRETGRECLERVNFSSIKIPHLHMFLLRQLTSSREKGLNSLQKMCGCLNHLKLPLWISLFGAGSSSGSGRWDFEGREDWRELSPKHGMSYPRNSFKMLLIHGATDYKRSLTLRVVIFNV